MRRPGGPHPDEGPSLTPRPALFLISTAGALLLASGATADPRAWFKFVIAEPGDLDEVLALQREYAIPSARIQLMPEGRTPEALRTRARWLAEICLKHEFLLTDRLHIHLYGDTRGT